jgi:hypothetical protein
VRQTQLGVPIGTDERFEDPIERCEIYADEVRFSRRLTLAENEGKEDGLCKGVEIASQ